MADLKATAKRFYDEVFGDGDIDVIDELLTDDFVDHEELPGFGNDRDGAKAFMAMLRDAFPDLEAPVDDMIAEGNKVVVRARLTGTHKGEFLGIPATGKSVDVPMIDIIEFSGDKAAAHWGITDMGALMEQLGISEMPG